MKRPVIESRMCPRCGGEGNFSTYDYTLSGISVFSGGMTCWKCKGEKTIYDYFCPDCGKELLFDDSDRSKTWHCPKCKYEYTEL